MSRRVLMIDKEPDQVEVVKERLSASGFLVDSTADLENGLDKIKEDKPDVILLDVSIPEADGIEACKAIKQDEDLKDIPIVVFSAHTAKGFKERCKNAGADDLIGKPYESNELVEKLNKYIK